MNRFVPVAPVLLIALVFSLVAPVAAAVASTAEEFLNAPVWYLEYEVSFTSSHSGTTPGGWGAMPFTSKLERVFSDTEKLNLRSGGPGALSITTMMGTADGSKPSVADQQKMATKMMSMMDHTANWMVGGAGLEEDATDEEIAADSKPSSPFRIDYTRVETGRNLTDEMGETFDLTVTTTLQGAGQVLVGGFGAIFLEMDTAEKTYTLALPYTFNAASATAQQEIVAVTTYQGKAPDEDRKTSDVPFDLFPSGLALDQGANGAQGGAMLLRGKIDPAAGKISGEQTFQGHYTESNQDTPGTFVVKYTLR
ncbi:MAG TPA: hypothetical protein VFT13_02825, partial [Candidatus Krumholzibacteria bacterium]|nr:hypothetical protein [Candidatus Krumholzibacteria bacterium]